MSDFCIPCKRMVRNGKRRPRHTLKSHTFTIHGELVGMCAMHAVIYERIRICRSWDEKPFIVRNPHVRGGIETSEYDPT